MMVWMAETTRPAQALPPPTPASRAVPSASYCWGNDTVSALNDQTEPTASDDATISRFTWWDHRGREWVQFRIRSPADCLCRRGLLVGRAADQGSLPRATIMALLYKFGDGWKPVAVAAGSAYGTDMDRFDRLGFQPVETRALRLDVQLQPDWSGGIPRMACRMNR